MHVAGRETLRTCYHEPTTAIGNDAREVLHRIARPLQASLTIRKFCNFSRNFCIIDAWISCSSAHCEHSAPQCVRPECIFSGRAAYRRSV